MSQAKRVVLVSRPRGEPKASDFRVEEYAPPAPGDGQVLLRTIWLSDPDGITNYFAQIIRRAPAPATASPQ